MIIARRERAAVPALLKLASGDPDVGVRIQACRAVGELGERSDVAALEEVRMGDRNRKVKKAAEQAIRRLIKRK
jgi:HEAT repeat protein